MTLSGHIMKSHNFLFPNQGFLQRSKLSTSVYLHTAIPQASQTHLLSDVFILQVLLNRNLSTALAPRPFKHPVLKVLPSKFSSNTCPSFPSQGPCSLSNLFTYESHHFPCNPATLSFIQLLGVQGPLIPLELCPCCVLGLERSFHLPPIA